MTTEDRDRILRTINGETEPDAEWWHSTVTYLVQEIDRLSDEHQRRVYYQNIVYAVCTSLDKIFGRRIHRGEGVVCGTPETPTTQVQDLMKEAEQRCMEWAAIKTAAQHPESPEVQS